MLRAIKNKSLVQRKWFNQSELQKFGNSFLSATNATYIENLYNQWLEDKNSVHSSWDAYFHNEINNLPQDQCFVDPSKLESSNFQNSVEQDVYVTIKIQMLKLAYQQYGHFISNIDPLHLDRKIYQTAEILEKYEEAQERLNPNYYGFNNYHMDKEYSMYYQNYGGMNRIKNPIKLEKIIENLKKTYCGTVGYEFSYIDQIEQKNWILDQIENDQFLECSKERKTEILEYLCENETLNLFLKNKFPTSKRFGIEGCDTTISSLKALVQQAGQDKVDNMVFGMAHRGRLNTLSLVLQKPLEEIFAEFKELKQEQSSLSEEEWGKTGDVKYHLGITHDAQVSNDHTIRLSILPNPSHLETVNPVVYGKVKAHQDFDNDIEKNKNIGVLLHGDAAHAGQGIVYETYQFQDLKQYSSGGVIHIITNNQIGFTTAQRDARSGLYATEVAKTIMAPIFHVNADDPVMVDKITRLALEFRQKFKRDVVIDIVGYRRLGHNELDQPTFTQPLMYQKVQNQPNVYELYVDQLIKEGVITKDQQKQMESKYNEVFGIAYEKSRKEQIKNYEWIQKSYEEIKTPIFWGRKKDTGVPTQFLKDLGMKITQINGIQAHPQINKIFEQRQKSIVNGGIDFGTSEALAFASLLHEGFGVRLSGQDVERGTFSHRHAVVHDQKSLEVIRPIDQAFSPEISKKLTVSNSHLSEYGVLGFEYGYNIANPNYLVMWEAQFGDFSNTAQIMIDNYITSGEAKWKQQCGLVMLLPHGMDGNGPEHSSARLERYLQLSDDNFALQQKNLDKDGRLTKQNNNVNFQLAYPTTSANYFHLLRRQMRRDYRKPLIVMTSKKLLRFKPATSNLEDFDEGKRFRWVIPDDLPKENIKKVIFCSGQVYYDILDKRTKLQRNDVAIIRLEQLSPFPYNEVSQEIQNYPNASLNWCQEEHRNQGAWTYVQTRFRLLLEKYNIKQDVNYYGRVQSASSATGSGKQHQQELQQFLNETFEN